MVIGLLLLGSAFGFLAALVALVAGQSLLTVIAAYFGAAWLTVFGVIGLCAWKHTFANDRLRPGFIPTQPE